MRVRWTPRARTGFRRGIRFIAENSPQAASEVATRISNATAALGEHPYLGREGRVEDTRELVVSGTRMTVAYRVRGPVVEILGVVHQAQEWPAHF